ncbi:MAG TPA: peptidoglycan bridge formation glycyltransferase FemA/FemB family protein [Dictyobacter sp.]|jgi:peptidoglycan pentaglycine glycine transferase (the first glycine)|nr:peptidoglycan bridge formation glycyltransferase FemA/FemB family protein [Dictyobacter sp.]
MVVDQTASSIHYILRPVALTERALWDTFVGQHEYGHLLQSWRWGELKGSSGWHPLRLAFYQGTQIVAAAQVLCKTAPYMPLRFGHLAYIPKGPVLDWSDTALCEAFFTHLHAFLRRYGALAVQLEPEVDLAESRSKIVLQRLQEMGTRRVASVQPRRTIVTDLTADEKTLLSAMKEKWRYNVRLGVRKGVTVRVATSTTDVEAWYDIYQTTSARDQFGIHPLEYYTRAWQAFAPDDTVRLLLAEHEGTLLAGIFISVFARQAIYLYGASSNEKRQLMPNYVLQWEAMRWAKEAGACSYDFWGIPETDAEDEAMAGVYRFKRGWGGHVVEFPGCYEYTYHPLAMKLARRFV